MTSNRNGGGRRNRMRWLTPGALLVGAALLSSGFVHRSVHRRRGRHQHPERVLEREAAQERFAQRALQWRNLRQRRRMRGGGWARGRSIELQSRHYTFGRTGNDTTQRLSSTVIHRVLTRHNSAIARCLMKHGASNVTIKLRIRGTGRVSVVTTDLAGVAARCVKGVVQKVRFPANKGSKTTSTYRLRLN